MVGKGFQGNLVILENLRITGKPLRLDDRQELFPGRMLPDQCAGSDIVDAWGDADINAQGGPLRLVLLAGARLGGSAGPDEFQPRLFYGGNELLIFGHET